MSRHALTELQIRRNADAVPSWEMAGPHRQRVTQLLVNAKPPAETQLPQTLCVLGAGNCNDLHLPKLCQHFQRVDLVDLDTAALEYGLRHQGCQNHPAIRLHGDCDVTGAWPALAAVQAAAPPAAAAIDHLLEAILSFAGLPSLGRYGAVASTCLLSQLMDAVWHSVGQGHPRALEVAQALRLRHVQLLAELLVDGGQGVLITDFVSSQTNPQLPSVPLEDLPHVLAKMIQQHNFFTALNPFCLAALFVEDPQLARDVESAGCQRPWLWNFGPRHYAVTSIPFRRRQA